MLELGSWKCRKRIKQAQLADLGCARVLNVDTNFTNFFISETMIPWYPGINLPRPKTTEDLTKIWSAFQVAGSQCRWSGSGNSYLVQHVQHVQHDMKWHEMTCGFHQRIQNDQSTIRTNLKERRSRGVSRSFPFMPKVCKIILHLQFCWLLLPRLPFLFPSLLNRGEQ